MNKVLFVATSDIHIGVFHIPYLQWLKEIGCEVHLAIEKRSGQEVPFVDRIFYLTFPRKPLRLASFTTLRQLGKIIQTHDYDLVHSHTPVPSMLARVAARRSRRDGTSVLYTAHGFHFFKGGPLKNWLIYFPAEFLLSAFTDGIITINAEDYEISRRRLLTRNVFRIKGIGVDPQKFRPLDEPGRDRAREALGYEKDSFILLYVAEFIYRKNHRFILEALPALVRRIPNLKVLFAGTGVLLDESVAIAKRLEVDRHVDFLGFRDDVPALAAIADVGISASRQEGLGLGLAEEMLCGVPVVATVDRGHREMVRHGINGFLFGQRNHAEFISYILKLYRDPGLRRQMGTAALESGKRFSIDRSLANMACIYGLFLNGHQHPDAGR